MAINPIAFVRTFNEQLLRYQLTAFPIADEASALTGSLLETFNFRVLPGAEGQRAGLTPRLTSLALR